MGSTLCVAYQEILMIKSFPSQGGVTIEEVFVDGTAARDNRLRPGDIILKVDKMEVTSKALARAALALGAVTPLLHLTVYRPARVSGECKHPIRHASQNCQDTTYIHIVLYK